MIDLERKTDTQEVSDDHALKTSRTMRTRTSNTSKDKTMVESNKRSSLESGKV